MLINVQWRALTHALHLQIISSKYIKICLKFRAGLQTISGSVLRPPSCLISQTDQKFAKSSGPNNKASCSLHVEVSVKQQQSSKTKSC